MKRINPFYLLIVSVILFILSIGILQSAKSNMKGAVDDFTTQQKLIEQFSKTQGLWFNEKKLLDTLKQIISLSGIKNVKQEIGKQFITIEFEEKSLKKIEKFVNSLLNSHIIIEELIITDEKVRVKVRDFS